MYKLKEYLKALNDLVEKNPQILEFEVIYSHDDEGNEFQKVMNSPVPCYVDNIDDSRFLEVHHSEVDDHGHIMRSLEIQECNAVLIN